MLDAKAVETKAMKIDYGEHKTQYNKNEEARNIKIKEMTDKINLLSNSLSNLQTKQIDYALISSSLSEMQAQIIEIKKQLMF